MMSVGLSLGRVLVIGIVLVGAFCALGALVRSSSQYVLTMRVSEGTRWRLDPNACWDLSPG